ncbi:MAG: hypothetical protein ACYTA3_14460 [Planctomycetota bacterium]|jgi:hypothetical protein
MPRAQEKTAAADHGRAWRLPAARIAQYSVSRKKSLDGVDHPQQRARPGEGCRAVTEAVLRTVGQGPSDNPEDQQAAQDVDHDVEGVVAAHVEPADPVVDRKRRVDDRPPRHRGVRRRRKHVPQRPQMADGAVLDDGDGVVVDKRPGEAVGVGSQADRRQQPRQ